MRAPNHDPAEIRRLLEQRQAEKLTYTQLSQRSGIPVYVFTYRMAQDRKRSERGASAEHSGFVEVVASATAEPEPASDFSGIELMLPGELRVILHRRFDGSALSRLLSIVGC